MPEVSDISEFGSVSPKVGIHASTKILYAARKSMITYRFGEQEDIPKGTGTQIVWRRYKDLQDATAPIQGDNTPSGEDIDYADITSTVRQYGKWVPISKRVGDTIEDPQVDIVVDRLKYNMASTLERVNLYILRQGSNVYFTRKADASAATQRSEVGKALNLNDIRRIVADLRSNNVEPLTDIISPNPNVGTEGIEEAYFALCHTLVERGLVDLGDDFVKVAHYPNHMKALPGEIGAVEGVRFIRSNYLDPNLGAGDTTTAVRNTTGAADVYSILFFGKGAFGVTKLAGTEFNKVIIKNPGSSGSSDPMNQRGSAAWVGWHACKILEQSYMARLETAVPKLTV